MHFASARKFLKMTGLALAAFGAAAASPAMAANSSANTAVDIAAPIEEAQEEALAKGDPAFRELFASWTSIDDAGADPFTTEIPTRTPQPVSVPSLRPLDAAYMTSGFGMRRHPVLGGRRSHKGIDLAAPTGTPVYATADGMVSRADRSRSYGLVIYLDHGAELQTRYAHLSKLLVADGEMVSRGDLIGYVGSTGQSTGPHLHYEVRVDGVAVNPIPYMTDSVQFAEAPETRAVGAAGRQRPGVMTGQGGE
jgi:murein DD-endopeptidase MepM/ murein hydrolase activator NlpD